MIFLRLACVPAKRLYSNAAAAMGDSAKIADLSITTAPNGPVSLHNLLTFNQSLPHLKDLPKKAVKYSDLWRTHRCVIVFFRRFG